MIGYSAESHEFAIRAAVVPGQPALVQTSRNLNTIQVSWQAPAEDSQEAYGAAIFSYSVFLQARDGTWHQKPDSCPDSLVLTCSVDVQELLAAPFELEVGDSIQARVIAENEIGYSANSDGNGATVFVVTVPDQPVNLRRDEQRTTTSAAAFTWDSGLYDGGS